MLASILFTAGALLAPFGSPSAPTRNCLLDPPHVSHTDDETIARFEAAVHDYVLLHRRLVRTLPPAAFTEDDESLTGAAAALADAIRAARPTARAGHLFDPEVADLFRSRIGLTLQTAAFGTGLARLPAERRVPEVHDVVSPAHIDEAWPSPLLALPALPEELEYGFVGRHLVVVDRDARLIVDVLPDALPAGWFSPEPQR